MVQAVLAVDQGTTNSKAALVTAAGHVLATASAPVGLSTPRPGWVEQDATDLWQSVLTTITTCLTTASSSSASVEVVAVALSTQRESVVGWDRSGEPVGPVLGWQDVRTAEWCAQLPSSVDDLVRRRTGLRVDAMFSAPKMRWLLDRSDAYVGTVDAWLIHRLTGCQEHLTEAGNASRTLLYDTLELDWSTELLEAFNVPRAALPDVRPSNAGFGVTKDVPGLADGIPIVAVLADSHAAMYGQGCTQAGMAKATYGTGSSVMTPVDGFVPSGCTLAWLTDRPMYALEGNIVSSGAALAWTADLLGLPNVGALTALAATVPSAEGVVLVPAFAGLGAPHWDREARAALTGMSSSTTRAHIARAAVDAVAHQICDITDTIPGTLSSLRADGGATVSELLMQTQADLLGHPVEAADVSEISALGVAELAWTTLGETTGWAGKRSFRTFEPEPDAGDRGRRRAEWAQAVASVRVRPA
ncbi:FGGY family carbohydrate kinase [Kribbella sp. VKM Ac-2566]|uniref:FGGY family carbohydrate kinase n=1 Tax=Kribbella sp. VKM Ac-2566 TaxID=2512218 RepID=UPI001063B4A2|nr:FGGY family carbohydrate kinase [Kribbella sp. VKM Ac-2566]TDW97746.1 glycerol kinase [Kribbella sp. VKM Ac-2566]